MFTLGFFVGVVAMMSMSFLLGMLLLAFCERDTKHVVKKLKSSLHLQEKPIVIENAFPDEEETRIRTMIEDDI